MNSGRYILSQVLDLMDRKTLARLVERHDAESRVRHFGCRQQLICMAGSVRTECRPRVSG